MGKPRPVEDWAAECVSIAINYASDVIEMQSQFEALIRRLLALRAIHNE